MSLPRILANAADRLTSRVGVAVLIGLAGLGLFNQATQSANQTRVAEQFEQAPEGAVEYLEKTQAVADVFNLGLSSGLSTVASVVSFFAGLLLLIVALRAFGRDRFGTDRSLADDLGWTMINLGAALIAGAVLFFIGFVLFGIVAAIFGAIAGPLVLVLFPVLLLGFLVSVSAVFYVPSAIAIDGRGVIASFQDSFDWFTEHSLTTLGLVVLLGVVSLSTTAITALLIFSTAPVVTASSSILLSAVYQVILYAVLAQAYVVLSEEPSADPIKRSMDAQPAGDEQFDDAWTDS